MQLFNKFILAIVVLILFSTNSYAAEASFSWLPNTDHVTGYKIYCGEASREYTTSVDVGMGELLEGRVYATITEFPIGVNIYCAATAYNEDAESDYSDEVMYRESWTKPNKPENFQRNK